MRLFLTFGTTHGALAAERVLRAAGVGALVVPKPAAIRGNCGLAVRLNGADEAVALATLARAGRLPAQRALLS